MCTALLVPPDRDRGSFVLGSTLGGLALTVAVKTWFGPLRPPSDLHAIPVGGYGFPSGHAIQATIVYGTLAAVLDRGTRRLWAVTAGVVITLIALSHVVQIVNSEVDVLAEIAVGADYLVAAFTQTRRDTDVPAGWPCSLRRSASC